MRIIFMVILQKKIWKCMFIFLLAAVIVSNLQNAKHHQDIIM